MSFSVSRALARAAQTTTRSQSTTATSPVPSTSSAPILGETTKRAPKSPATSRARTVAPKAPILPPSSVFEKHTPLPLKAGLHVATLHFRSHTTSLEDLTFFASFAQRAAKALGLPTSGIIALPTRTSLFTVPRSPFAHKKSQENFWRKEHKRAIKVFDGNEQVVEIWLAYLRKEAMGGVGMKAQIFRYKEVGYGQKMVTSDGLRQSAILDDSAEVKAMAEIIQAEIATAQANEPELEMRTGPKIGEVTEVLEVEALEATLVEEVAGVEAPGADSVKVEPVESSTEPVGATESVSEKVEVVSPEAAVVEEAITELVEEKLVEMDSVVPEAVPATSATSANAEVVSPEAAIVEEAIVELVEEKLVELDTVVPQAPMEESVSTSTTESAVSENVETVSAESGGEASESKEEEVAKVLRKAAAKPAVVVSSSKPEAVAEEEVEEAASEDKSKSS